MTGWLVDGADDWHGLPVVRTAAEAAPRRRAAIVGVVREVAVRRASDRDGHRAPTSPPVPVTARTPSPLAFEARLDDGTGEIVVRWSGRDGVAGVASGVVLHVEGTIAERDGRLVIANPLYRFVPGGSPASSTSW